MSECQNVRMYECKNVRMSECQNVRMSECKNVRMSECQNVRMSECENVRMSECQNVRMSECENVPCTMYSPSSAFLYPLKVSPTPHFVRRPAVLQHRSDRKFCGCHLCHSLVSEDDGVGNLHNDFSVCEANGETILLRVVLVACLMGHLLARVEVSLALSTASLVVCQHVHHHFDGELQAVRHSRLFVVNLSLSLSVPRLSLQLPVPVLQQRLVQDQRAQTGLFLWRLLFLLLQQLGTVVPFSALSAVSKPSPSCTGGCLLPSWACVSCDVVILSRLRSLLKMSLLGQ